MQGPQTPVPVFDLNDPIEHVGQDESIVAPPLHALVNGPEPGAQVEKVQGPQVPEPVAVLNDPIEHAGQDESTVFPVSLHGLVRGPEPGAQVV